MPKNVVRAEIPRLQWKNLDWARFLEAYSQWQAVILEGCASARSWELPELARCYDTEQARCAVKATKEPDRVSAGVAQPRVSMPPLQPCLSMLSPH